MGDLFSELSSGSVKKNIRFNATNTKVKQDRLQTPEEIIKERRRIHHNTYTLQQWRSRRNEMKKEEEEMLKQIAKDYEAMPTPITTPRQVDTLFLKENLLDIIDRSGKI